VQQAHRRHHDEERGGVDETATECPGDFAGRDIEREIAPLCLAEGVAILPWSPLAGGLLSGKFDPDKKGPADARRASFDFPPVNLERLPRVLSALRGVAVATGTSVARVALAWQLTRPFVTSIIIGAKKKEQLVDNLAATELRLSSEQLTLLDEASALPAEYPGWMVEFQNKRDPRGAAKVRRICNVKSGRLCGVGISVSPLLLWALRIFLGAARRFPGLVMGNLA